jgi:hypothetical protein
MTQRQARDRLKTGQPRAQMSGRWCPARMRPLPESLVGLPVFLLAFLVLSLAFAPAPRRSCET